MEFDEDTVNIGVSEAGEVVIEPDYLEYLRSHGYTIEGVSKVHTVESTSREQPHLVCQIETYAYPKGHEKLDIAAHKLQIPVCSCERFKYQESVDVSEMPLNDGELGVCPHLKKAYKELRAANDEDQTRL